MPSAPITRSAFVEVPSANFILRDIGTDRRHAEMNFASACNHLLLQRRQQRTAQRKIKAAAGCRVLDTEQLPVRIAPFAHAHLNGVGDHAIKNTQRLKNAQAVLPEYRWKLRGCGSRCFARRSERSSLFQARPAVNPPIPAPAIATVRAVIRSSIHSGTQMS